jgi:N-acetylglucosaminyl-diphospho-decaprenol L-rhamnosyltransferase
MTAPPEISVVVVTYNSAQVIGGLLDSLETGLGGLSAEVLVVDNGSADGTAELVEARGDCRVVRSTNVGYAGGINIGAAAGSGTGPLLLLNPDVRLEAGAVPAMMRALAIPGTGIVGPKVLGQDGHLFFSLRREPTLPRALGLSFTRLPLFSECCNRAADYEAAHTVDWALGAVLLVARDCFDALGGFDESYFLYSEETDFALKARQAGWATRYEPAASAMHIGQASGFNAETHAMQIVNRVRFYARHHGAVASWAYLAAAVAAEGYRAVLGVQRSRRAVEALLRPLRRPPQLHCSVGLLPR